MKKIIAVLLSVVLVLASVAVLSACSKKDDGGETPIDGGWSSADATEITDEVRALFDKLEIDGATYTPIAYLGSQVVAGTNHRVLCAVTPAVPDAKSTYAVVTLYEDLEGNVELTEVLGSDAEAYAAEGLAGGWVVHEEVDTPDEAKEALAKASETLTGAEYSPVKLLASQVVAGMNYQIFCEMKATVPDATTEYAIVYVYADLQGNAEITDTYTFSATNA